MVWNIVNIANSKTLFPLEGFRVVAYAPSLPPSKTTTNHDHHHSNSNNNKNNNNYTLNKQQSSSLSSMLIMFGGVGVGPISTNRVSNNLYTCKFFTQQPSPSTSSSSSSSSNNNNNNNNINNNSLCCWTEQSTINSNLFQSKSRMDHAMCIVGHHLYVLGGRSSTTVGLTRKTPLSDDGHIMYMLNLKSFVWSNDHASSSSNSSSGNKSSSSSSSGSHSDTAASKMGDNVRVPVARFGHTLSHSYASTFPKIIFMFGGVVATQTSSNIQNSNSSSSSGGGGGASVREVHELWMFDTVDERWYNYDRFCAIHKRSSSSSSRGGHRSEHVSGPRARHGHLAHIVNNHLYIIGGTTLNGQPIGDIWKLNLTSMEWCLVKLDPSLESFVPVRGASSVLIGSKIVIYGGRLVNGNNLSCLLVFDTLSAQFGMIESSTIAQIPNGLVHHSLVLNGMDIWLIGGRQRLSSLMPAYNSNTYCFSLMISDPPKPKIVSHKVLNPQTGATFVENEVISQLTESDIALREQKIDLICQLMRSSDSSEYSRLQALMYMRDISHPDTLNIFYSNINAQQALIQVLSNGNEEQVIVVADILRKYVRQTDQGFIPTIVTTQMIRFLESYLTHVDSAAKLQQSNMAMMDKVLNFQLYDQYMLRFEDLMQNFDYYQSISKDILNVFIHVFQLSQIEHPMISHIVHIASRALLFLAKNAHNFATKCKKTFCKAVYKYLSAQFEMMNTRQMQNNTETNDPVSKQTVDNVLQAIYLLSQRSKTVAKQLDYFIDVYENQVRNNT